MIGIGFGFNYLCLLVVLFCLDEDVVYVLWIVDFVGNGLLFLVGYYYVG